MQNPHSRRFIPLGLLAGFSLLAVGSGGAIAWLTWQPHSQPTHPPGVVQKAQEAQPANSDHPSSPANSSPTTSQKNPSPSAATAEKVLQVYWLQPVGDRIKLVASPAKLASGSSSEALLQSTINQLLAGPASSSHTTTIPQATTLRSAAIKADGVHLDLSRDFTTGGGSTSMVGRVAQVLYTVTSSNPDAKVWLSVEGKPLETLGGEGLVLEQPMTRDRFQQDFPDSLDSVSK